MEPTVPANTEATIYVFDSYQGWLGDSPIILSSFDSEGSAHWIGEAMLGDFLKWVVRSRRGNLLGHKRLLLVDGERSQCFLPDPDPQVADDRVGKRSSIEAGFGFSLTPRFVRKGKSVSLNYQVTQDLPQAKTSPPEDGLAGRQSRRLSENIAWSIQTMDLGTTIVISHPQDLERIYVILIHIGCASSE